MKHIHYFETKAQFNEARANNYIEPWTSYTEEGGGITYNKDYTKIPFTIEAVRDCELIFGLNPYDSVSMTISYSNDDGSSWNDVTVYVDLATDDWEHSNYVLNLNAGDKILLKGNNTQYNYSYRDDNGWSFSSEFSITTNYGEGESMDTLEPVGKVNIYGNIMSLIYGDNFVGKKTFPANSYSNFYRIFKYAPWATALHIISAENLILPATTLTPCCYLDMFQGCTSLTIAPELPATTLANYCYCSDDFYSGMFYGCKNLIKCPSILPATTLTEDCYNNMFNGCTSLTTAPSILSATTLTENCYEDMFSGCTSLTTAPELPATTLAEGCYSGMFNGCTSLTTSPELPATTLADSCYWNMFFNCSSLTTAPALPATTLADYCYISMFSGCTSLTVAPKLPATTLTDSCYQNMFYGCTNITAAPALPATTLTSNCYADMFLGCSSLNYIKCLTTDISASSCTSYWVFGVASSGTFIKSPSMTGWTTGDNGIPTGWTVVDAE